MLNCDLTFLFKKLLQENFHIEEKWPGIYYISKEGFIRIQFVITKNLSLHNHIWLKSLSDKVTLEQATKLLDHTQNLCELDDKNHADSLWEIVTTANEDTFQTLRRDKTMCQALARIMKPEIDEAFNNGFDDCKKEIFKNMLKKGLSKELAQECADINDELAEKILAEL